MKRFKKNASVLDLIWFMNVQSKKLKFTLLNTVSARASANPLHKSEIAELYIEEELRLNLYRISVWLVATVGLRCFVQLASNMIVVVHSLIRDCRIRGSTKQ